MVLSRFEEGFFVYSQQTTFACYNLQKDIQAHSIISVVDPPSGNLSISSSSHSFIYLTGDSVNLTCTVFGGNPIANLSWECSSKDPNTVTRSNSTLAALVLFLKVDKTFNNKDCTCRSSHPLQNKNKTVTLIVQCEYFSNVNDDELSIIHVFIFIFFFQMKAI